MKSGVTLWSWKAGQVGQAALGSLLALLPVLWSSGCNPYERHGGEYLAGSVDPVKFPAAYLGDGGDPKRPGGGTFKFVGGFVGKTAVSYYPLPFSSAQEGADDPLDVGSSNLPLTYIFDPQPGVLDGAASDSARCMKPQGYVYDDVERREQPVRRDRQGNVFTRLPDPSYIPVVREVVVSSHGNPCQDIKSEATLLQRTDVVVSLGPPTDPTPDAPPLARPSGNLLAMAIIDPAADVQLPDPDHPYDATTMLGPQRWGFFGQYLLAYLDGGYIPQQIVYPPNTPEGTRRLVAQDLYFPSLYMDEAGMLQEGQPGLGFDVMQFRRGQDGYSPVCRVRTFVPADPMKPETAVTDIDQSTVTDTGRYIYCLQLP